MGLLHLGRSAIEVRAALSDSGFSLIQLGFAFRQIALQSLQLLAIFFDGFNPPSELLFLRRRIPRLAGGESLASGSILELLLAGLALVD